MTMVVVGVRDAMCVVPHGVLVRWAEGVLFEGGVGGGCGKDAR